MKMTVTSVQRTFTATLKTILPYNLFLLYLYLFCSGPVTSFASSCKRPPQAANAKRKYWQFPRFGNRLAGATVSWKPAGYLRGRGFQHSAPYCLFIFYL